MSYGTHKIKEVLNVAHLTMTYGEGGVQVFTIGKGDGAKVVEVAPGKHLDQIIPELQAALGL
jgi:hypothetical protein